MIKFAFKISSQRCRNPGALNKNNLQSLLLEDLSTEAKQSLSKLLSSDAASGDDDPLLVKMYHNNFVTHFKSII